MPHICMDEVMMLLAMLPFIGAFFNKLHAKYHSKHNHHSHQPETAKDNGACEEFTLDMISYQDVVARFSQTLIDYLKVQYRLQHFPDQAFTWYVGYDNEYLEAHCDGRVFTYDTHAGEGGWDELTAVLQKGD